MDINIRQATDMDIGTVSALALLLWPHHAPDEMAGEMAEAISSPGGCAFLAEINGEAVALALCALRHDYVEGTSTSPVGYLEGIYVKEPFRRAGIAAQLSEACERWAGALGCTEFASDCALENTDSIAFHLGAGFTEANRLVCFTKSLKPTNKGGRI